MNRFFRFGLLITLTIYASTSLVACANNTLQMTDRDVLIPSVRMSLPVVPKPETGEQAEATWSGVTLDGEVSYLLTGEDRQTVPAAEQVALDKVTVAGPATVKTRARALDVTATARTGLAVGDTFTLEPVAGIQVVNVELELVSPTGQGTDVSTSGGFIVGGRSAIRPLEFLELYGQYTFGYLFGGSGRVVAMEVKRGEVGARVMSAEALGLFAGYRWATYDQRRESRESDANLKFRGPVFGVELHF